MEFSPQQDEALQAVARWLQAGKPQLFRLFGYAGTGKTTLARYFAEHVDGHDYYEHWLAALEGLLASKGLAARPDVDAMAQAWERAAHATPHGKPILLENDPHAAR